MSTTGVAGLTLGGGSGWLERQYGLACDNLVSVDLVLADGEQVTASKDSHPDLFWALHGGGGNFGVATSFEFQLYDVGPIVHAGLLLWGAESGDEVMHAYRAIADGASEKLATAGVYLTGPPEEFVPEHLQGQPAVAVAWCWFGSDAEGDALIAPLRALRPEVDLVGPMPYADFQCMIDDPPGKRNYWSAEYLADFGDDAVAAFVKASADMPTGFSQNLIVPWGGAVARVSDADTPMTNREAAWVFHPFGVWEGAERDAEHISWAKDALATMRKYATGGIYLNFIGDEGQDRVRAAYGDKNYAKLAGIKRQYDPENVFHRNQNIKPAYQLEHVMYGLPSDGPATRTCDVRLAITGVGRRRRWGCGAPTRRASRWWRGGVRRASRPGCAPSGRGSAGPRRAIGRPGARGRRRRGGRR